MNQSYSEILDIAKRLGALQFGQFHQEQKANITSMAGFSRYIQKAHPL